ncbi:MAG TPA: beta-N-acetylhexosaminidase [Bryobacteraceae bacterium]|nr:beta-N-acetylhexosaminidase [Bryobacteraceae bacterium]
MRLLMWAALAAAAAGHASAAMPLSSPLSSRGYSVLPQPQQVELQPSDFPFGSGWSLVLAPGVTANDAAVETLREDLQERFGIAFVSGSARIVRLTVKPGSVAIGTALDRDRAQLEQQAYRIELSPSRIDLTANASAGLLYAAATLTQLVTQRGNSFHLPAGRITDWPDLQLRQIYWDDAHHLERLPVLKAALRQAAFYKINGFVLKLEGHFQFHSAPAVVEPYALTPAELQELTDYALHYHVQLIPYLDGPSHIAFILKHPEYNRFREFAGSNYELCATNPDAINLLLGMFHDLLDANKGVKYVYLSTDEAYYIGLADTPQCREKPAGTPSQLLAKFVTEVAGDLHARSRDVIFWGEYPLKSEDIPLLPQYVINGETYGPQFDPEFRARGIRQMIYTSTEGEEDLFPDYFALPASQRVHAARPPQPHVEENIRAIASSPARQQAILTGMINAGWADRGLHPETFWLGYATSAAAGWNPAMADAGEARESFYAQFYGAQATRMDRVYQLMSQQAQFWKGSWDTAPSESRKPIWGNSAQIFDPPHPAKDQTLALPPADSEIDRQRYRLASENMATNDELIGLLRENMRRVERNRYNLEIFLSIAQLYWHNLNLLTRIDNAAHAVQAAREDTDKKKAVAELDRALATIRAIQSERDEVLHLVSEVWQRSWFPRVAQANGRTFVHELDDVKDHLPDRTVGMEYLVYREFVLPWKNWETKIELERRRLTGE